MTAIRQKKRLEAMNSTSSESDKARASLVAFLRKVFTVLANERQKESLELRKVLETLR